MCPADPFVLYAHLPYAAAWIGRATEIGAGDGDKFKVSSGRRPTPLTWDRLGRDSISAHRKKERVTLKPQRARRPETHDYSGQPPTPGELPGNENIKSQCVSQQATRTYDKRAGINVAQQLPPSWLWLAMRHSGPKRSCTTARPLRVCCLPAGTSDSPASKGAQEKTYPLL